MSITFSGLGSGLDTASWVEALVEARQTSITSLQTKVSTLTNRSKNLTSLKSQYTSFNTILNKLMDSKLGASSNVFNTLKASSSNETALGVTASSSAVAQTLDITIGRLATSSTAKGTQSLGKEITEDTKFSELLNGNAKAGSFSFYVDDEKFTINVNSDDTLGNIKDKMVDATKSDANPNGLVNVNIQDGKFSIDAGTKSFAMGSTQDKSNLISALNLKKVDGSNEYESAGKVINLNLNAKVLGEGSPYEGILTAGTFKIGEAEFTIDENTTLNSLMAKINGSTGAGVEARINGSTGQLELTAKTTGAFNIGVENGTSNFLEVAGLMAGNKIAAGSQTTGENALLTINGKQIESFSNTVTSETSGLSGIVLNLNDVSEAGKSIKVKVEKDSSSILDVVKNFVAGYNSTLNQTVDLMTNDSTMRSDIGLSSIRSGLRSNAAYSVAGGGAYASLSDIGITTKAVGTGKDAKSSELILDEAKFMAALEKDPEAVQRLLIGTEDGSETGVVGKLKAVVDNSLKATDGYFTNKSDSIQKQITSFNKQITTKNDALEVYRQQLTNKFNAMDAMIAKLNQQYSSFLS